MAYRVMAYIIMVPKDLWDQTLGLGLYMVMAYIVMAYIVMVPKDLWDQNIGSRIQAARV